MKNDLRVILLFSKLSLDFFIKILPPEGMDLCVKRKGYPGVSFCLLWERETGPMKRL
jgi:hypothetical protein